MVCSIQGKRYLALWRVGVQIERFIKDITLSGRDKTRISALLSIKSLPIPFKQHLRSLNFGFDQMLWENKSLPVTLGD